MRGLRVDRRQFLQLSGLGGLALAALGPAGCSVLRAEYPGPDWSRHARVAGEGFFAGYSDAQLEETLDRLVEAGASVLEGDSSLSDYLGEVPLAQALEQIRRVTEAAHQRNLRVIWYYPALEVITPHGADPAVSTISREHPDWVQVSIDGKPNVFTGSQEHWVDPDAESAWMCHLSPYRDFFFDRLRRLAQTGVDAAWIDVPLYMTTAVEWCCASPYCNARFLAETGLTAPTAVDWTSPTWRRWIAWRHEQLNQFCLDLLKAAQAVRPDFQIAIETFGADFSSANVMALDGSYLGAAQPPQLFRVWEVDSVSNTFGMKPASADDWLCKLRQYKFARACDRGPTWAFCYGYEPADAALVMGSCLAAGCAPYETQTPRMAASVGADFRSRWFHWIRARREALFDAASEAQVGVLQSSASRDYVDQNACEGQFATHVSRTTGDPTWWCEAATDVVGQAPYLSEYTGLCQVLSHLHVPFRILPAQSLRAEDLAGLRVLLCPELQCVSQAQAELLLRFASAGGTLLFTGAAPGASDQYGTVVPGGQLGPLLGFDVSQAAAVPVEKESVVGKGRVRFVKEKLGQGYLVSRKETSRALVAKLVADAGASPLQTDADRLVHLELTRLGSKLLLHAVNYRGAQTPVERTSAYPFGTALALPPQDFQVTLRLPEGRVAGWVLLESPEPAGAPGEVPFTTAPGTVTFRVQVAAYALASVSLA